MFYKVSYKGWKRDSFYYVLASEFNDTEIKGDYISYCNGRQSKIQTGGLWYFGALEYCDKVTDQETITMLEKLFNVKKTQYKIRDMSRAVIVEGKDPYFDGDKTIWNCEIVYEKDDLPTEYNGYNKHNPPNNCLIRTSKGVLIFILKSQLDPIIEPIKLKTFHNDITVIPGVQISIDGITLNCKTVGDIIKAWNSN